MLLYPYVNIQEHQRGNEREREGTRGNLRKQYAISRDTAGAGRAAAGARRRKRDDARGNDRKLKEMRAMSAVIFETTSYEAHCAS